MPFHLILRAAQGSSILLRSSLNEGIRFLFLPLGLVPVKGEVGRAIPCFAQNNIVVLLDSGR